MHRSASSAGGHRIAICGSTGASAGGVESCAGGAYGIRALGQVRLLHQLSCGSASPSCSVLPTAQPQIPSSVFTLRSAMKRYAMNACRCLAEVFGTAFAIWLGQSVVANELLAHTKGHGMGFGWVSFGERPGLSSSGSSCASTDKYTPAAFVVHWAAVGKHYCDTNCLLGTLLLCQLKWSKPKRHTNLPSAYVPHRCCAFTRRVWTGLRLWSPADRLDISISQPGTGVGRMDQ